MREFNRRDLFRGAGLGALTLVATGIGLAPNRARAEVGQFSTEPTPYVVSPDFPIFNGTPAEDSAIAMAPDGSGLAIKTETTNVGTPLSIQNLKVLPFQQQAGGSIDSVNEQPILMPPMGKDWALWDLAMTSDTEAAVITSAMREDREGIRNYYAQITSLREQGPNNWVRGNPQEIRLGADVDPEMRKVISGMQQVRDGGNTYLAMLTHDQVGSPPTPGTAAVREANETMNDNLSFVNIATDEWFSPDLESDLDMDLSRGAKIGRISDAASGFSEAIVVVGETFDGEPVAGLIQIRDNGENIPLIVTRINLPATTGLNPLNWQVNKGGVSFAVPNDSGDTHDLSGAVLTYGNIVHAPAKRIATGAYSTVNPLSVGFDANGVLTYDYVRQDLQQPPKVESVGVGADGTQQVIATFPQGVEIWNPTELGNGAYSFINPSTYERVVLEPGQALPQQNRVYLPTVMGGNNGAPGTP